MKLLTLTTLLTLSNLTFAQTVPNFTRIFGEIDQTNTITDAMAIREQHIGEMRNLDDFNRLTDLEKLSAGQAYFSSYDKQMAVFISDNLKDFINPDRKNESNTFLTKVYPKVKKTDQALKVAETGLAYVNSCEEFNNYAAKTNPQIRAKYVRQFCNKGASATNELRSILFQPRTLEEGRWDSINFNDYFYVKKIYISAEGLRNDAYFDVMVNGDIKGTVYVPGRDPSYVITVEDYADSILLRSLSGNARILSVILDIK